MSDLNHEKLAEQFDELSSLMSAIAGTFRPSPVTGKKPAVAAKAAGPGKAAKPPAKVEAGDDDEETEVTIDDVREALKELNDLRGKEVMIQAMESVGAGVLADVDESQYPELMAEVARLAAEEPEEPPTPAKKTAGKKTAKKAGPTLEEVQTAARALIDADKPAYAKLVKKMGKPSEMDEANYATALAAYEAVMPEEADEDDDSDV